MNTSTIPVAVEALLCSRFRCTKSSCEQCLSVCPARAVTLAPGSAPSISQDCVGCGACVSACPNGAIQTTGAREEDFDPVRATDRQWAEHLEASAPGGVLRLACSRVDAEADATFACLGRLTEPLLLALYRRKGREVRILKPDCGRCPWRAAGAAFDRVEHQTRAFLRLSGIAQERLQIVAASRLEKPAQPPRAPVSRRAFIMDAVRQATGILAESVMPGVPAAQSPLGSVGISREKTVERKDDPKRAHLLETLAALSGRTGSAPPDYPADSAPPAAGWVAAVEVAPECMGCNVCEALCPTGAIRRAQTERLFSLFFTPSKCTACDVCVQSCYPRALRLRRTGDPAALLGEEQKIFESRRGPCSACGAAFVSKDPGDVYCPICLAQEGRRMALARRWLKAEK